MAESLADCKVTMTTSPKTNLRTQKHVHAIAKKQNPSSVCTSYVIDLISFFVSSSNLHKWSEKKNRMNTSAVTDLKQFQNLKIFPNKTGR